MMPLSLPLKLQRWARTALTACSVPLLMTVGPLYVLTPVKTSVPLPTLVNPPSTAGGPLWTSDWPI